MAAAVHVTAVSKSYQRRPANRPTTLKEAVLHRFRDLGRTEPFWALRGVTFDVEMGRMVGLIGPNGAGKSTLLRLIGGVGRPDMGTIQHQGRLGALLDLGAGFHPDLTGRENAMIAGVISGLTRHEIAARFDAIVAFAELETFIDSPLRVYSTGMAMRLAFAVAVHTEPDILLIDEVLAVGDLAFQQKCMDRITDLKAQGCAIVLVSHDAETIRRLCDEVVWLRHGEVVAQGGPEMVVDAYVIEMNLETRQRTPAGGMANDASDGPLRLHENRWGSLDMEIIGVRLLDRQGIETQAIDGGAALRIELTLLAHRVVTAPHVGVTVTQENGTVCLDLTTVPVEGAIGPADGPQTVGLDLDRLDLAGGTYSVSVGVYEAEWAYAYDYHWQVYPLLVHAATPGKGLLVPPYRWDAHRDRTTPRPDHDLMSTYQDEQ